MYICSGVGVVTSGVAIVATLSGSWTPLIGNTGAITILGGTIQWGAWSWSVVGVAVASLVGAGGLYIYGERIRRDADARIRLGTVTSIT
jgi:hypothetical protein